MLREWKGPYSRRLQRKLSERGRRMAKIRWDKWRHEAAARPDTEPKFEMWFPLELGVRDKQTGETAWVDLRSIRDAVRRLRIVLRHYIPGLPMK